MHGALDDIIRQKALSELLTTYMPGLRASWSKLVAYPQSLPTTFCRDSWQIRCLPQAWSSGRKIRRQISQLRHEVAQQLRNHKITRRLRRLRREVGFDEELVVVSNERQVVDRFDQEWVQQVVKDTLRLMEDDCLQGGRSDMWEVFRLRIVDPLLRGAEPVDYEQIVRRFAFKSPRQGINLLANAKRIFSSHLPAVAKYADGNEAIEAEISDLREIVDR